MVMDGVGRQIEELIVGDRAFVAVLCIYVGAICIMFPS